MARAILLIRSPLLLVGTLAAAGACAGGSSGDSGKRPTNTFNMVTAAAAGGTRVPSAPSTGGNVAPKGSGANPYNVPLLQNAGSLRSIR